MRYTIVSNTSTATMMGRDETTWTVDIDVKSLTQEQRETLAHAVIVGSGQIMAKNLTTDSIVTETGTITPESIQAVIEAAKKEAAKKEDEIRRTNRKVLDKNASAVADYEAGGSTPPNLGLYGYYGTGNCLNSAEQAEHDSLVVRRDAEAARRKATRDAKAAAWDAKYLPLIEAYENGADRPVWENEWDGDYNLRTRISNEDSRRKKISENATEERKKSQLTEAVKRLGTDSQLERWTAGVMARSEALDLIKKAVFSAVFEKYETRETEEYFIPELIDEYGSKFDRAETEKQTLTDEQWETIKNLKTLVSDCTISYQHQYYDCGDHDSCEDGGDWSATADIARIIKTVGEYTLKIDVKI